MLLFAFMTLSSITPQYLLLEVPGLVQLACVAAQRLHVGHATWRQQRRWQEQDV